MKNLLILATMLLTFSFANAQSKIYSANSYGSKDRVVGVFEGGYATGAAGAFLLLL